MSAGDHPERPPDRSRRDVLALGEDDNESTTADTTAEATRSGRDARAQRAAHSEGDDARDGESVEPTEAPDEPAAVESATPDLAAWAAALHNPPEVDEPAPVTPEEPKQTPTDASGVPFLVIEDEHPALEIREPDAIIAGENLHKQYGSGTGAVNALNGVTISLYPGTFTAIMGPSGSGKSTLMHLLAGLDTPTRGEVWIGPTRLGELGEGDRTRLRRNRVGFVFQSFNLLPMLTVEQNITLPQRIAGREVDSAWLEWLLAAIGLEDRRRSRPAELSGGEQQRVSLARALLGRPAVVFADEPTGNLDSRATEVILTMLRRAVQDLGQTIVIVTHDHQAAARADRIVFLEDGRIVRDT